MAIVATNGSFSVSTPVAGLSPYSAFARASLAGQVDDVVGPIESGNFVYVIKITGRSTPDPSALSKKIPGMRERLLQQKVQNYVIYWFDQLRDNSKIEDLREVSS